MTAIILPYPDKRLSPNARVHHMELYRAKSKARDDAYLATMEATSPLERQAIASSEPPIQLSITIIPPTANAPDEDNIGASLKAARDGIAMALCVNDREFRSTYSFGAPEKPGRVIVEIGNPIEGAAA